MSNDDITCGVEVLNCLRKRVGNILPLCLKYDGSFYKSRLEKTRAEPVHNIGPQSCLPLVFTANIIHFISDL